MRRIAVKNLQTESDSDLRVVATKPQALLTNFDCFRSRSAQRVR